MELRKRLSNSETLGYFDKDTPTLRWLSTAFAHALADGIQCMHKDFKKNKQAVNSAIIYSPALSDSAIFLHNLMQCIDSFSIS